MAAYYDSEGANKCSVMSEEQGKFYTDLKERRAQGDQQYSAYAEKFSSLSSQFQEKISQHSTKFESD